MLEHIKTGDTVYFVANFYNSVGGYSLNSQEPPRWLVYENGGTTSMLGGVMTKRSNITGSYIGSFSATLANGFDPNNFYDIQVSGKINNRPDFISVKQFVLDELVPSNLLQIKGSAVEPVLVVDANVIQVSGKPVSLTDFNTGGGTGGGTMVSGVVDSNLTQINGQNTSLNQITTAVWNELTKEH